MATATIESCECISEIGKTAGKVWHILNKRGPMSPAKLTTEVKASRDVAMQAIGWLAREEKILIEDKGRSRVVSLR